ncbi:non-structural maintenance of chromosomes element 4 homolog A-like isoform X2 [Ornithodoros turicata]
MDSADQSAMETESSESCDNQGRQLRRAYRDLINGTISNGEETVPLTVTLKKAKDLFGKVTRVQEAALDSELVLLLASKARKAATTLPVNFHTFDPEDFLNRVRRYVTVAPGRGPLNQRAWAKIGKRAEPFVRSSNPLWYTYGSMGKDIPRPPRAPRTRMVETGNKAPTIPNQVKCTDTANKETTTERVELIHRALKGLHQLLKRPLPFIELVMHPDSFAKTCENIFHTSFLVNEGHADIFRDDRGVLMIEPVSQVNSICSPQQKENVFVMTVTRHQWRDAVKMLALKEPAIPDSP